MVADPGMLDLLPAHRRLVEESAISPEVATARGYRSVRTKADLKRLGFGDAQCRAPALLIPVWGITGGIATYQSRPDTPRVVKGKALKYETPAGSHMVLDIPPQARPWLPDPRRTLWITEGVRKADSAVSHDLCCVALLGVWNWRGSNEHGGKMALPDWESIPLNGRVVYVAFDSDVMGKAAVYAALERLGAFLSSRGANVHYVYLPAGAGGTKTGLDDFFAAGRTVDELLAHATDQLQRPPSTGHDDGHGPYEATERGLIWHKPSRDGATTVPLTNFTATIVSDIAEDDGAEIRRQLEIEARLNGRMARFSILAERFSGMNWATEHLGASAIVYPGISLRDHARVAIQLLSRDIPERQVYAHLGWRQIGESWVYLHAGGAIGADGPVAGIEVRLPESLHRYTLPDPPSGDDLRLAIASLRILRVAPAHVTYPLLAAIYRAPIGDADFGVHAVGDTGTGKTEITALAQQHYGLEMDARHLPGSWTSTGNSLEALAFAAKDAILTVDDFAPGGTSSDIARLHREADRLLRAQGNHAGRLRMRADTSFRPAKAPRGLIVSSGEDIPRGQSLRARLLILDLGREDIDWDTLTICQQDAAAGHYAAAMSGYLQWLAPRYADIRRSLKDERARYREAAVTAGAHQRTPGIVADLAIGLHWFLTYAQDVEAISTEEAEALWQRGWDAIGEAAGLQVQHQAGSDPVRRFGELLSAAIGSGECHIAGRNGDEPESPAGWGWRLRTVGTGEHQRDEWQPQGKRIGWLDGDDLYLEPEASYAAANRMAGDGGDKIAVAARTLHKRLHERGLLASVDKARGTLTVRKVLEGSRRNVLHLQASYLSPKPDQTDHEGAGDGEHADPARENGQFPWSVFPGDGPKTDHKPDQNPRQDKEFGAGATGNGQVGQFSETYKALKIQRPSNGCADCGAPCGSARLCSPCATKATPVRGGGTR